MTAQENLADSRTRAPSLEKLYRIYRDELRAFFVARGRRQDADDLLQEIFLDLVHRPPPAELRDAQSYLFRVAWNTLHGANRREKRKPAQVSVTDIHALDVYATAPNALWLEDNCTTLVAEDTLIRALHQLPRTVQVALLRQYRDGRSYRQIAEELGCSTHAVKKYISRALNEFRKQFTASEDV